MQFKLALVFVAAAFCSVQAFDTEEHVRNLRDAADFFGKAANTIFNLKDQITLGATEGIQQLLGQLQSVEQRVASSSAKILAKMGFNVDVAGLLKTLQGNIRSCAVSDEVKTKAAAIKGDLLSCIETEIKTIEELTQEISDLAKDMKDVPGQIQSVVTDCKAEGFTLERLSKCAASLKTIMNDANLLDMPVEIIENVQKAVEIATSIKDHGAQCFAEKAKSAGSEIVNIAKSVASCIHKSG